MNGKKRSASIKDTDIEALTNGLYRFATAMQAQSMLTKISKHYVVSKETIGTTSVRLWIKGFSISESEKAEGFWGNYAIVTIHETADKHFTLKAENAAIPLAQHPQKRRQRMPHPNWGHPVLRNVRKAKPYPTLEQARHDLLRLYEDFHETSIPGTDKLHLMIYTGQAQPPISKITLRIVAKPDQTYLIQASEK